MKMNTIPIKWLFLGVSIVTALIMSGITLVLFALIHQTTILVTGGIFIDRAIASDANFRETAFSVYI